MKLLTNTLSSAILLLMSMGCSLRHLAVEEDVHNNYETENNYYLNPANYYNSAYDSGFLAAEANYALITGYGEGRGEPYNETLENTYYVNLSTGDDETGDGSIIRPWKTLEKIQKVMQPGDTFYLGTGNYGIFRESNKGDRSGWITFKAYDESTPTLSYISIRNAVKEDTYLRFDGITISSPGGTVAAVDLLNVRHLEITNCRISGENKYLVTSGMLIDTTERVLIYHNDISSIGRGILIVDSEAGTISTNHLHDLAGRTGLQYERNNRNFIIEKNNIHNSNYDPSDPNAPVAPHASAISIRSGNLILRSNIFHDIGSSSGMMMYDETDVPVYNNIYVLNNLFYDIQNTSVVRLFSMGANIYFVNNTIIGKLRDIERAVYRLYNGMNVEEIADGYDGTGLHVYNNLFAGTVSLPPDADVSHNIFWSYFPAGTWFEFTLQVASDPNTLVLCDMSTQTAPFDFLQKGFFAETRNAATMFEPAHHNILDYRLAEGSQGINFGNPELAIPESLGSISPDGFIIKKGVKRDPDHHSIGCYEFGTPLLTEESNAQ